MPLIRNPRTRVLLLIFMGFLGLLGWFEILHYYQRGHNHWIAIAGLVLTLATMGVLARSYITRRGLANTMLVLSLTALVLSIIAMVFATL